MCGSGRQDTNLHKLSMLVINNGQRKHGLSQKQEMEKKNPTGNSGSGKLTVQRLDETEE